MEIKNSRLLGLICRHAVNNLDEWHSSTMEKGLLFGFKDPAQFVAIHSAYRELLIIDFNIFRRI